MCSKYLRKHRGMRGSQINNCFMSCRTVYHLPLKVVKLDLFFIYCATKLCHEMSPSFFRRRNGLLVKCKYTFLWEDYGLFTLCVIVISLSLYEVKLSKVFFPPLALTSQSLFLLKLGLTDRKIERKIAVIRSH